MSVSQSVTSCDGRRRRFSVTMPKELPFPLLKPQELREMLSGFLSVDVHVSELERPTPEVVQRVFESTVQLLVGSVP